MNDIPKILIVDDDRLNIKVLGSMLVNNYEIVVAINGEQALQLIESNPQIDLILLDIQMPGIDGFEVCKKIKNSDQSKDIPIIFITANRNERDEKKGLKLGAVDYITKPFSRPIVELRVKNHLDLKRQRDLLEHISGQDSLTNIANRRKFDESLDYEWKRALREKNYLSLILIDIDFFKNFNDFYGHVAGDDCIIQIAQAIEGSCDRSQDLAARYGGEEFVCLLPNTESSGAIYLAETIRKNIAKLQIPHEKSLISSYVTISAGVNTVQPDQTTSPLSMVQSTDKMLYKAKEKGRNQSFSY